MWHKQKQYVKKTPIKLLRHKNTWFEIYTLNGIDRRLDTLEEKINECEDIITEISQYREEERLKKMEKTSVSCRTI